MVFIIPAAFLMRRPWTKAAINANAIQWKYSPATVVGKLISALSAKTTKIQLDELSGLDATQKRRLGELTETLKADPKKKAKETRASKTRLEIFVQKIKDASNTLADAQLVIMNTLINNVKVTADAAKAFAEGQFDSTDLPGTRDDLWRNLWDAAREYSISGAYEGQDFPVTEDGARCVLCQQPIDAAAVKRMQAFEAFCKDRTQQLAKEAAKRLNDAAIKVKLMTSLQDECPQVEADLAVGTEEELRTIAEFVATADARLTGVKDSLARNAWTEVGGMATSPADTITAICNALEIRAKSEESAEDPTVRQSFERERAEMLDREWLGRVKGEVLNQIARYQKIAQFEASLEDVTTRGVTSKNSELTKLLVTDEFCQQFKTETDALGLRTLKVKLQEIGGSKGETRFGLRFEDKSQFTVREVASEGERRCIALAAFLAELSQASHQSALVFDDPVSSLDHWHRERIAVRLVQESKIRQVIVFTHDASFLNDLHTNAEEAAATSAYYFLDWKDSQPGWCYPGLPWDCKTPQDRLDKLEKKQREIAQSWGTRPSQESVANMREAYGWLRSTIERIVERIAFADVVFRFRSYVNLKNLDKVVGFSEAECTEINRLFKKCCEVTESHDRAQGKQQSIPEPKDLQIDINATKQLLVDIRARQNAAKKMP